MNRRLKYVPMLCVCLIGMLVSCGTVKRASGLSGNKAVVEEKDPLTLEQRRKYDYFFLEALRMKEKGDLDAAFEMYSHCLDIYPQGAATLIEISRFHEKKLVKEAGGCLVYGLAVALTQTGEQALPERFFRLAAGADGELELLHRLSGADLAAAAGADVFIFLPVLA